MPAHIPVGINSALLSLAREPGVGEENVDRPIFGFRRGDQRLDIAFLPDIGGHSKAVDVTCDAGKPVAGALEIGDHHAARAGLRIGASDRRANAARRSRHHTDLVFDVHAAVPRFAIVIRVRPRV